MKLFVVGSDNPRPDEWEGWDEVRLVVAKTKKEAVKICGLPAYYPLVAEVDMSRPCLLMSSPGYVED